MKKIVIILVVALIVVVGVVVAYFSMRTPMMKNAIAEGISSIIGTEVSVGNLEIEKETGKIKIDQILISNFADSFNPHLAKVTNLELACDVGKLTFKKGLMCSHIQGTISQIWVDRTDRGIANVRKIKALQPEDLDQEVRPGEVVNIERAEMRYGQVVVTEATAQGNRKTVVDLKAGREVYGYLTDLRAFVYLPTLKVLASLNRGSLGIPRHRVQQRLLSTTGQRN